MKIREDLENKMTSCLNGDWTPTQCWHYAYGIETTLHMLNNKDYEEALRLIHIFKRVMERL